MTLFSGSNRSLPADVKNLVKNMGKSMSTAFQAHVVEVEVANEQKENEAPLSEERVAEAAEESPGAKYLDAEASMAAREIGKRAGAEFQSMLLSASLSSSLS